MSVLTISSPSFANNGKSGIMVPDETGYYDQSLGGLNTHNSKGEFYLADGVEALFGIHSKLYERAMARELHAELGHPTPRPGESPTAFISRAMGIDEKNTCAHIREITLDLNFGRNNPGAAEPNAIAIRGKIAPNGVYGYVVKEAIENKYQQLAFSIRAITDRAVWKGKTVKKIVTPITFDYVNSPGIKYATKNNSLSLESEFGDDYLVDVDLMKEVLSDSMNYISMESADYRFREELLETISKTKRIIQKDRKIFLW